MRAHRAAPQRRAATADRLRIVYEQQPGITATELRQRLLLVHRVLVAAQQAGNAPAAADRGEQNQKS
jgi:hypothetical protein